MKRRTFVKSVGTAAIGMSSLKLLPESAQSASVRDRYALDDLRETPERDNAFWELVRHHFPLTRERAFFNTGGLGASPHIVIEAVRKMIDELEAMGEVGRSQRVWDSIKEKAGQFIDAEPDEIALTGCCTESMNCIANGLPLKRGDEVLVTTHEHVGGALPWLGRARRDGIVVKTFKPGKNAAGTMENMTAAVSKKTRVISVSHITCTAGAVLPVREICDYARSKNIWSVIDGAQAIGHLPVSMKDIGCDCYATSGHKWMLGPKRTGLLFVRKELLDSIEPVVIGAYSDAGWDFDSGVEYHPTAQRYEFGTYNVPVMHGLGVAIDFLSTIGMEAVYERSHALAAETINALRDSSEVEILTPLGENDFASIVTVRMKNMDTHDLQRHLSENYRLRTRYVAEAGLNALRISIHLYNNRDEVHRFIEGVREAARM
jgi:cysteine desulfurase / selenocysteine lyase